MPSSTVKHDKINLDDIANISEDEFKQQITNWIEERGISKALQSKLRADLFEQFNKTNLGRQIALKHQHAHRLILSPMLLALNTLVAEFLYSEDCHFSLSVFATEVPFRNALPDFETGSLFRFSESELNDILEAIKMSHMNNENMVRRLYTDEGEIQAATNTSLLYCIFKGTYNLQNGCNDMPDQMNAGFEDINKETRPKDNGEHNDDHKQKRPCSTCNHGNSEKFQINSRYFKYLNRYLDILSDRIQEMSESLARMRSTKTANGSEKAGNSIELENSIKMTVNQMQEHLADLSKSKKKHKKFQDIINSVEKLSNSLEKCSGNLESLFIMTTTAAEAATKSTANEQLTLVDNNTHNKCNEHNANQFKDYSTWLHELKMSENGKKFIARLEASLQKTLDKEKEHLKCLYDEKMENYRVLIKLHYKQKYAGPNIKQNNGEMPQNKNIDKFAIQKDDKMAMQPITSILRDALNSSTLNDEKHRLHINHSEKEKHVEQIVETAK